MMSTLYRIVDGKPWPIPLPENPSYKWGGGGMIDTPTDLIKMTRGYLNGFLSNRTLTTMWTRQQTHTGEMTNVGVGWRIDTGIFNQAIRHHAGSMGGARSVLVVYPNDDQAIATTTNATWTSSVLHNAQMLIYAFQQAETNSNLETKQYTFTGYFKDEEHNGLLTIHENAGWITVPNNMKNCLKRKDSNPFGFITSITKFGP